jgi:hypothetical protein
LAQSDLLPALIVRDRRTGKRDASKLASVINPVLLLVGHNDRGAGTHITAVITPPFRRPIARFSRVDHCVPHGAIAKQRIGA